MEKKIFNFTDALEFLGAIVNKNFSNPQCATSTLIVVRNKIEIVWLKRFFIRSNLPLINIRFIVYDFFIQNLSAYLRSMREDR